MPSIENLKHFVAAVENKGVIKASEKVFISPSSITRSIQLIEAEAGRPLFDRVGRSVQLNRDGRRFYDRAKAILGGYEGLFDEKVRACPSLDGHYSIGASHFLCERVLPGLATGFLKKYPRASLEAMSLDSRALLRKVHSGELDIGLMFSPRLSDVLDCVDVFTGRLYLCGGKRHVLVDKPFSFVKEKINDLPAIIHRPTDSIDRCDNHPMFRKYGIRPQIRMYWDSDRFALNVLAANAHWSILPEIVIDSDPRLEKFRHPEHWDATYRVSLVWNKEKTVPGLKDALLALMPKRGRSR